MQTDGDAGRPDAARESTVEQRPLVVPARPAPRVCAVVDDRECGLAAVRRAAALAAGGARPLMVIMRHRVQWADAMASVQGIVMHGARELRVNTVFRLVAAALAETGTPWEFHALDEADGAFVATVPTTIVVAAHRRGHLRLPWTGSVGVKVVDRALTSVVRVGCDRGRHPL